MKSKSKARPRGFRCDGKYVRVSDKLRKHVLELHDLYVSMCAGAHDPVRRFSYEELQQRAEVEKRVDGSGEKWIDVFGDEVSVHDASRRIDA